MLQQSVKVPTMSWHRLHFIEGPLVCCVDLYTLPTSVLVDKKANTYPNVDHIDLYTLDIIGKPSILAGSGECPTITCSQN